MLLKQTAGESDNAQGLTEACIQWIVLRTKPRQEKAVGRFLEAKGTKYYLPLVPRVALFRGRKLVSEVPLFPGYVFLAGELQEAYDAIATKRVCQLLEVGDQRRFVEELDQIRCALANAGVLDLYPFAVAGTRCRVTRGPFIGIEGVITDRLGPDRLVLQLAMLGQGAALEIDIEFLEPLE